VLQNSHKGGGVTAAMQAKPNNSQTPDAATSIPVLAVTSGLAAPTGRLSGLDGNDGVLFTDGGPVAAFGTAMRPVIDLPIATTGLDLAVLQALVGGVPGSGGSGPVAAGQPAAGDPAMVIARQVADMAQGLAALADRLIGQSAQAIETEISESDCVAFLEAQFRVRRLRSRHLPGLDLGEPAWDMLLDLAVAQYWRRETSVTSLCIAADVPSTTALRWINSMTKAGLIVRRPCLRDGRRSFLAISSDCYQAMLALAADALRAEQRVRVRYQRSNAA